MVNGTYTGRRLLPTNGLRIVLSEDFVCANFVGVLQVTTCCKTPTAKVRHYPKGFLSLSGQLFRADLSLY